MIVCGDMEGFMRYCQIMDSQMKRKKLAMNRMWGLLGIERRGLANQNGVLGRMSYSLSS